MCKATEGLHFTDPRYGLHMRGMRAASVLPGAYHFAWPNEPVSEQADHYAGVVRADADAVRGFHHWLDLERNPEGTNYAGCTAAEIRAYAEAWIARVKAAFPRQRVGCYTSADDIAHGHYPHNADALWYPAYPAGPLTYAQAEQRSRPAPSGMKPLIWQFADAPTDRSIAYLTPAALHAWAGTPLPEDDMQITDKVTIPAGPWNKTPVTASVGDLLGYTNLKADAAVQGVRALTAQVGALTATVALLAKGGTITAAAVQAASKAGALEALEEGTVHVDVEVGPPTASGGTAIPSTN
jgi:hypothetical protein